MLSTGALTKQKALREAKQEFSVTIGEGRVVDTMAVTQWLQQARAAFIDRYELEDEEAAKLAATLLRGQARDKYRMWSTDQAFTWNTLVTLLTTLDLPLGASHQAALRGKLWSHQQPGQRYTEYVAEVQEAMTALGHSPTDPALIESLVSGLRNRQQAVYLKQQLRAVGTPSFNDVVTILWAYNEPADQRMGMQTDTTAPVVAAVNKTVRFGESKTEEGPTQALIGAFKDMTAGFKALEATITAGRSGNSSRYSGQRNGNSRRDMTCYYCHKPGHGQLHCHKRLADDAPLVPVPFAGRCFKCEQQGHREANCPQHSDAARRTTTPKATAANKKWSALHARVSAVEAHVAPQGSQPTEAGQDFRLA